MAKRPPCGKAIIGGYCQRPRAAGKRSCRWHWLLKQPANVQAAAMAQRKASWTGEHIARMPKERCFPGERWCAGCQSFVPLFYCSGSRCKACASTASHEARVQKVYGLAPGAYDALFRWQGGRCYVCQRKSLSRRLAVDHDHETGEVRGLLCPDPDRGCNHKVVGLLDANSTDGPLAAAKRLVAYYEASPYQQMLAGLEAYPQRFLRGAQSTEPAPF